MAAKELTGRVAIVTGASSGIGAGIAVDLARHGCRLTLTARNVAALNEVKATCMDLGLKDDAVLVVKADLMVEDEITNIMDSTIAQFGRLDILVNNAGIVSLQPISEMTMSVYHEQMQVNLHSVVFLTKLAIPHLEKTKGSIIVVSSIVGMHCILTPAPAYCMTKAAVDQFVRCCAMELAPRGIRVNSVCPGVVKTGILILNGMGPDAVEAFWKASASKQALLRNGEVEEIAAVVTFLVSDKAQGTTGSLVPVAAGYQCLAWNHVAEL